MRTRHWLAAIISGCMALAGLGKTEAQQPYLPTNGNPDQTGMGMLPAPMNSTYGPATPGSMNVNQPGYPPGANPWPGTSPFAGPPYDQTVYENGFWWNRTKQSGRKYYGSIDAVYGHSSKPTSTLIGAPNVNPLSNDPTILYAGSSTGSAGGSGTTVTTIFQSFTFNGTPTTFTSQQQQFNQTPGGSASGGTTTGGGPIRSAGGSTGGTGGGTGGSTTIIFPAFETSALSNSLNAGGVRANFGWFNSDDTGFVVSGFYQAPAVSSFQLFDPLLNLDVSDPNFNAFHLHAWFGLPLAGADTDATTAGTKADGAVVPYDMGVRNSLVTNLAGTNIGWYFEPIYEQGAVKVRPTAGARYVRLDEAYQFDAYDSGTGYTVSSSSAGTGGTGGTGGAGGTGSTGGAGGLLSPSSFQTSFTIPNITHSQLNSRTLANMAGPEFGFRIDLGGKKFQLWTQTKGGALANVSQRNINGFGIGNEFNITAGNTIAALPKDPNLSRFDHTYMSTTMSPMFEQQINTKMPVFGLIPYIRNIEFFERAQLTGGFTFLWIGNVYRPTGDINWNQTVVNVTTTTNATTGVSSQSSVVGVSPTLNSHRSDFYNAMFNLGVEWEY